MNLRLKKTIAQWTRLQTIASVFVRHGFSALVHELGLSRDRGKDLPDDDRSVAQQLRKAFEELGPTFIKMGQLLSTRPDLIPEDFVNEFSKLTDSISAFPYADAIQIIESEFGRPHSEIFEWIEEKPLAAASMAQVHRAKLRDSGQAVVLKIQRPGIELMIQGDLQVLHFVSKSLEKLRPDFQYLNLVTIVEEFQRSIYEELDFTLEARNIDRFRDCFSDRAELIFPEVVWETTSKRVLTMTEIPGQPLSHMREFPESIDRVYLAETLVTFFLESMFFHGFFHADAHAGNVFLDTSVEGGRIGILDFGMVGNLNPDLRKKMSRLFMALVSWDFDTIASIYSQIGRFRENFSIREFQRDVSEFLSPHLTRPLREIKMGQVMMDSVKIARKYQIRLPRDLIMFYRSLITLESLGRKLDPDFEFMTYGRKFGQSLMRRRFSPDELFRDFMKAAEGFRSLSVDLPTHLKALSQRLENEDFPFGTKGLEKAFEPLRRQNEIQLLSSLCVGFLVAAALVTGLRPESWIIWPLWAISFLLSGFLLFRLFGRDK